MDKKSDFGCTYSSKEKCTMKIEYFFRQLANYVKNQGNECNKLYQGEMIEGQISFSDYV